MSFYISSFLKLAIILSLFFIFSMCSVHSEGVTSVRKIDSLYMIGYGDNIKGLWLYKPYKIPDSAGKIVIQNSWLLISRNMEYIQYDNKNIIYRKSGSEKYYLITNREKKNGEYHTFKNKKQFDIYRNKYALKDSSSYLLFVIQ